MAESQPNSSNTDNTSLLSTNRMTKTKRILLIHQGYELYGSDKMFILTVKSIISFLPDLDINIIIPKKGELYEELIKLTPRIEVKDFGILRKSDIKQLKLKILYQISFGVFTQIKLQNQYDIVYINSLVILDHLIASRFSKAKTVLHLHEIPSEGFTSTLFKRFISFSKAQLISISKAVETSFKSLDNKKTIILNGVPDLHQEQIQEQTNVFKILLIGRINSWKGQLLLLKAIKRLKQEGNSAFKATILGDVFENQQHYKDTLVNYIKEHQLEEVVEIKSFSKNVISYYQNTDIVVIPSIQPEPFGLVAVEAMSHKKTIIASAHGGLTEIVEDKKTGFLIPPNNEIELAEAISYCSINKAKTYEMGERARDRYLKLFNEKTYLKKMAHYIVSM